MPKLLRVYTDVALDVVEQVRKLIELAASDNPNEAVDHREVRTARVELVIPAEPAEPSEESYRYPSIEIFVRQETIPHRHRPDLWLGNVLNQVGGGLTRGAWEELKKAGDLAWEAFERYEKEEHR